MSKVILYDTNNNICGDYVYVICNAKEINGLRSLTEYYYADELSALSTIGLMQKEGKTGLTVVRMLTSQY